MPLFAFIATVFFTFGLRFDAFAQAQRVQELFDQHKRSVVKIIVEGKTPSGTVKEKREGTGFFVYSDSGVSYIITALHVIGSSETEQSKNPDWRVENGTVDRIINVSSIDNQGGLAQRSSNAYPIPTSMPGVDLAILALFEGPYPTLELASTLVDKIPLRDVMLLGFQRERRTLTMPIPVGQGQLVALTYHTTVPSRRGESGAPWIDLGSGRVFAVASVVRNAPEGPSYESTPVTFIKPWLVSLFDQAGYRVPTQPSVPDSFKIVTLAGETTISISGDSGALASGQKVHAKLGEWAEARVGGREDSQCDGGSGRTLSQASATGRVSRFEVSGLRFEYALAAQGGHYRTAAACLGGLPVGITGHDTTALATALLRGEITFDMGTSPITLDWSSMPSEGARVRIFDPTGSMVLDTDLRDQGNLLVTTLKQGRHRLEATVSTQTRSRGSCCGMRGEANGTLNLVAAESRSPS